jgi:hypothetical protein
MIAYSHVRLLIAGWVSLLDLGFTDDVILVWSTPRIPRQVWEERLTHPGKIVQDYRLPDCTKYGPQVPLTTLVSGTVICSL